MAFAQTDGGSAGVGSASGSFSRLVLQGRGEWKVAAIVVLCTTMALAAHELALSRPASPLAGKPIDPTHLTPVGGASSLTKWPAAGGQDRSAILAGAGSSSSLAALARAIPLHFHGTNVDRGRALDCLAAAAWYEAGNDPIGQRSVMQVVLNRLKHPSFPKSICGVVFQGSERSTGCQFSFTCDGSINRRAPSVTAWSRARKLADEALNGKVDSTVFQATHYHADYVVPWWSAKLRKLTQVGAHIFYSWPGQRGVLPSLSDFAPEADIAALQGLTTRSALLPVGIAARVPSSDPGQQPSATLVTALKSSSPSSISAPNLAEQAELLRVDAAVPSGRWAVEALKTCSGRASCQIIGYDSTEKLEKNRTLPAENRDRPSFLFVRDAASGMDVTLWDCDSVERPSSTQCLPGDGPALRTLLRNRRK